MTWSRELPYDSESKKVVWEVAPYLKGRGLDIGAGEFKILPHAISVDNMHHQQFGFSVKPDVLVETAEKLDIFGSQSMDFLFSSHLLEHIDNYQAALKEWWRLVKQGGYMILYLPHKSHYPNIGQPGANPDHKHDFMPEEIIAVMREIGSWDLLVNDERSDDDEYSFLQIYQKL